MPALASTAVNAGRKRVRCWSAGCASGEEPYTVALMCNEAIAPRFPTVRMEILATDVEPVVLERAGRAAYSGSSLKHLPQRWRERGFMRRRERYLLRPEHRHLVTFAGHGVRTATAGGPFDLVLCRNVAFTYLASGQVRSVLSQPRRCVRAQRW